MVDYSFLKNGEFQGKSKPGRVEFLDVDLPATSGGPGVVESTRAAMAKGKEQIEKFKKKATEIELKTEVDLILATEMIGQGKTLLKKLKEAGELCYKPTYQKYKEALNIVNAMIQPIIDANEVLKSKSDNLTYILEMKRRDDEAKAKRAAAKLQAKIDAQQKKLEAEEAKQAKKEERAPLPIAPIVVDAPVVPKEIKIKTEHGSLNVKMILVPTITDIESDYIVRQVIVYYPGKYHELANKALNKAIDAGGLGLKGAEGVEVVEKADSGHRRR